MHRIGQTKRVFVHYIDAKHTMDEALRELNQLKRDNFDSIFQCGGGARKQLKYKELFGKVGAKLKNHVRCHSNRPRALSTAARIGVASARVAGDPEARRPPGARAARLRPQDAGSRQRTAAGHRRRRQAHRLDH